MAPNNRGRSTSGEAAIPYYPRSQRIEAAKHLRLTVTRYLADRVSFDDVKEAFAMLAAVADDEGAIE